MKRNIIIHFSCFLLDLKSATELLAEFSSTGMQHDEPRNKKRREIKLFHRHNQN